MNDNEFLKGGPEHRYNQEKDQTKSEDMACKEKSEKILHPGLTHPQIHLDFYEWRARMSEYNLAYMYKLAQRAVDSTDKHAGLGVIHDALMWAWSASRETLKREVENARNFTSKEMGGSSSDKG